MGIRAPAAKERARRARGQGVGRFGRGDNTFSSGTEHLGIGESVGERRGEAMGHGLAAKRFLPAFLPDTFSPAGAGTRPPRGYRHFRSCSSAPSRFSIISAATTVGAGRDLQLLGGRRTSSSDWVSTLWI